MATGFDKHSQGHGRADAAIIMRGGSDAELNFRIRPRFTDLIKQDRAFVPARTANQSPRRADGDRRAGAEDDDRMARTSPWRASNPPPSSCDRS